MCMYKKNMCLISVVLLLGMVGSALAAPNINWDNESGDRRWDNAVNWDPNVVPTSIDKAAIRQGGDGPIIDSSTPVLVYRVVVGDWDSTSDSVEMTDGTLTTGDWIILGYGAVNNGTFTMSDGKIDVGSHLYVGFNGTGTLDMSDGKINIGSHLYVGFNGTGTLDINDGKIGIGGHLYVGFNGTGTLNMNNGSITVPNGTFGIATDSGSGDVQLDGGTISCNSFSMTAGATMDINGGTLIVNGEALSTINGYISNGWLTGYGGTGTLAVDYNITNPGKTTVAADTAERASCPSPGNGATDVSINADLSWTAGIYAVSHDVYFGTDPTPDAGEFQGNQTETTYDPSQLVRDTTYYWRVDEVDPCNPKSPWVGDIWTFTTQISTANLKKGPYLIYKGRSTRMQVLWQLDGIESCSIEWGLDTSYSDGYVDVPEYGDDHQHKYTITGLTPGAKYYYKVTIGAGTTTGSFTAAPSGSATDVKFLMGGDSQSSSSRARFQAVCNAVNLTMAADPAYQSMLLFAGDLVSDGDDENDWADQWFNRTLPEPMEMMSKLPIQPCQGNHEKDGIGFGKYYPCPWVGNKWWSFDYGPVHVSVIDVDNAPFAPGSTQHNWLTNDLSTTSKPFKIVMYHQPAWSAGHHENEPDIQNYIQPLCVQYGVQICLNGHNHNYVHAIVEGVHHITSGGFGASLYSVNTQAEHVITAIETQNFQTVEVVGNTMTVTSLNTNLVVLDSFQVNVCGDGICEGAENPCNCPDDCGTPPVSEPNCTDNIDNDCDGLTDFADYDCYNCKGDIDNDKIINYEDFAPFGSQWPDTGCGTCGGADFTGEGDVTIEDLAIIAQHWLEDCALVGYWKLDGDSADSSYYGFDGTLYGNPVWDPNGRVDGALEFDGDGDYVKITEWRGITRATSRTVCAWVKTETTGDIVSWGKEAAGKRWLFYINSAGGLRVDVYGGYIKTTGLELRDGTWHHVAAILPEGVSDVGQVELYVDGIKITDTASSNRLIDTAYYYNVKIGYYNEPARYFNGLIDDVRIYNRALSQDEIANIAGL